MAKYSVYARIVGSRYLGEIEIAEGEDPEEATWDQLDPSVNLCHQCADQIEDPEIDTLSFEPVKPDGQ